MLGQPASSQTVCSPSRRTSDLSSVYSGPVRSLVLIHSGLRSIGVWLFRTSSRSSLRPAGSIREDVSGASVDASSMPRLMASTVLPPTTRPRARTRRGGPAGAAGPPRRGGAGGQPALSSSGRGPRLAIGSPAVPGASVRLSGAALAIGVSGSLKVLEAAVGRSWLLGSSGPEAGCASSAPMPPSAGPESDGAACAADTVLPLCDSAFSVPPAGVLGE